MHRMKIHTITRYLLAFLLFPALFCACTAESEIIDEPIVNKVLPEGTEFSVSFGGSANGLSVANIGTRAAGDDPNQITNLRLLVFDDISEIVSATSCLGSRPSGLNHHAAQLRIPITLSAAIWGSTGRNFPTAMPRSMIAVKLPSTVRLVCS